MLSLLVHLRLQSTHRVLAVRPAVTFLFLFTSEWLPAKVSCLLLFQEAE
jgi:hypothetical protein